MYGMSIIVFANLEGSIKESGVGGEGRECPSM